MAKRTEILHHFAVSMRDIRRNRNKQSASLTKALLEAQNAQRIYLFAQTKTAEAIREKQNPFSYSTYVSDREITKIQKERERKVAAAEKEMERAYTEARNADVNLMNARLDDEIAQLETILKATLAVDDYFAIQMLKATPQIPDYVPPNTGTLPLKPIGESYIPPKPTGLKAVMPGASEKYQREYKAAAAQYKEDFEKYKQQMLAIKAKHDAAKETHQRQVNELQRRAQEHNAQVIAFEQEFNQGQPQAIVDYFACVLEASLYPEGFPQHAKVAFVPESKQLVVEYDLPKFDVVPEIGLYKYVKTKDEISYTNRQAAQRKALYSSIIAQITIRTIHELFEADRIEHLDTIVFNGYVDTIDRGTGRQLRECLVTVRVTREVFLGFDLSQVDPTACLKVMNAGVSKTPEELVPVRPVLEFNMVDPRFIEETDVISSLDQRPNLMELTPTQFETLIANLFKAMGLETRQTQASRDGGVDCVAYDSRPILGGKVVIQAKRYKHTVGVSAVRDLFGTLQNEGASKGILVTTSGFGKASMEFAAGKPIELISGSSLLYLLEEHAGVKAKIVPPEGWKDPHPDSGVEETV